MTLLAGDVIDAARDRHAAFDRERAPQGVCLRFLSQSARRLHGKIMEIDEDVLRVEQNTVLPLADFSAGIALPANRTIVGVTVQDRSAVNPRSFDIDLVPANLRNDRNTPAAAAWQIGNKLYLRGAASDWTQYGSIAVSTVPIPPLVAKSSDVIDLPDTALEALADAIALQLAKRGVTPKDGERLPPIVLGAFVASAKSSEDDFLDEIRNRLTGRTFQTRDVMHYFG
jgi:hypothetical protein